MISVFTINNSNSNKSNICNIILCLLEKKGIKISV